MGFYLDFVPSRPDCLIDSKILPVSFSFCLYGNLYDAITSLFLQKRFLQGHNVRYKVMEIFFIHCHVSLEINNGQIESLDALDVKLFTVKVTPK